MTMEVDHSKIHWHTMESYPPLSVCMVAEDTQYQPRATSQSNIHTR